MNIQELRIEIDKIDNKIIDLLNKRMNFVNQVGEIKKKNNEPVYRPEREKEIIDRLSNNSKGKLNHQAIKSIFQEVFAIARNLESEDKISYLGPEGSFTHQAAENNFGSSSSFISLNSIKAVFESLESEKSKFGIIPLENNQEGIVQETIDMLGSSDLSIVAEMSMSISFVFASKCKSVSEVEKVYSKDIAFKQCKNFIEEYFDESIQLVPVGSTSRAVSTANKTKNSGAICSRIAAVEKGLPILFNKIENSSKNHTRFIVLSKNHSNKKSGNDKTSVLVRLPDGHGVLANFLQEFHNAKINLTKLESRPAREGTDFKYVFYIDFEGHYLDNNFQIILKRYEDNIKILGSYVRLI